MSRLSRRTMFTGTMAAAGLFALDRAFGGHLVRAQGAAYDIVSFGPVAEGVLPEGFFLPQPGQMVGIHPGGTAFGRVAASADKFTPTLFRADGTVTKLKSGEFGGSVSGINADGQASGFVYDTVAGEGEGFTTYQQPAMWMDGELVRLRAPEPEFQGTEKVGSAIGIADDGTVLGSANGYALRWTDGEPQILPRRDADDNSINYAAIAPDGSLIGNTNRYDPETGTSTMVLGIVNGTSIDPFQLPEDRVGVTGSYRGMTSTGAVLYMFLDSDLYSSVITNLEMDPIVIDYREDGVQFFPAGVNASYQVVGSWQPRAGVLAQPAIWQDDEFTPLEDLLPADHGFHLLTVSGISDDGVIAGSGYDEDGGFHPLMFVPA